MNLDGKPDSIFTEAGARERMTRGFDWRDPRYHQANSKPETHSDPVDGVYRVLYTDKRGPTVKQYVRFLVQWRDLLGRQKLKTFQVCRQVGIATEADTKAARDAAVRFRALYEASVRDCVEFDPHVMDGWNRGTTETPREHAGGWETYDVQIRVRDRVAIKLRPPIVRELGWHRGDQIAVSATDDGQWLSLYRASSNARTAFGKPHALSYTSSNGCADEGLWLRLPVPKTGASIPTGNFARADARIDDHGALMIPCDFFTSASGVEGERTAGRNPRR